jgi:hypothetical protein
MTIATLKEQLLTYGADLSRWPSEERKAAEALLQHSDEARKLLAEYEPVDQLFKQGKDDKAPPGLLERILDATDKK